MNKKLSVPLAFSLLLIAAMGCNALAPAEPTPVFIITEVESPPTEPGPPINEASVPRVELERAVVALAAGEALFIDVRSPQAYAESHITGAINIQLGEFETNINNLNLDKEQWIITYCT